MLLFLAASGLTLIFGVLGILNFAHGSFYMFGAYFAFFLLGDVVGSFWVAVVLAMVIVGIVGVVLELTVLRRVYQYDPELQLLLTFALVLVLENGARIAWGTDFRSVDIPAALSFNMNIFGETFTAYRLFIIVLGVLTAIALWLVFQRSRFGKNIRAAAEDREMAGGVGINVPLLFTAVFFVGSMLAGLGGALAAPLQSIHPTMGESIIIEAFIVIIIGGLGSFGGAFIGALAIGLINAAAFVVLPIAQPVIPFLIVAAVLILRPHGLFGTEVEL
jgi:branched-chain amino acid transport system permease protein